MKVVRVADLPNLGCETEVDDYVPFVFRLTWPSQGMPRYVRFYPDDDAPLELTLTENEHVVRSVVLLSMKRRHRVETLDVSRRVEGAPVLAVDFPAPVHGDESFAVDVSAKYSAALGKDFLEIRIGALGEADECIASEDMEYYTLGREIVGMRYLRLNESQMATLQWHLNRFNDQHGDSPDQ